MTATLTDPHPRRGGSSAVKRRWLFRALAVVFGLSLLVVFEWVCIAFDLGAQPRSIDPFVSFSEVNPLFEYDRERERYEVSPARYKCFSPDGFAADKPGNGYRIFVLGGSTVQGRPYDIDTSFTTFLRLNLEAANSAIDWEVVNCGGISYASYRLLPILEECLAHNPDLIIVCSGHNEFLESRTYGRIRSLPDPLKRSAGYLARLRSYRLVRDGVQRALGVDDASNHSGQSSTATAAPLPAEVDAMLDYHGGLSAYRRDEPWRHGVIEHFSHNIRRMVAMSRDAGVPIVLMKPTSNLADTPPFKSQHRDDLTEAERDRWRSLRESAWSAMRSELPRAIALLEEAVRVDNQHAESYYTLGKLYQAAGRIEQAYEAFWRAREADICPIRMIAPLERVLDDIASEATVPLVDIQALVTTLTPSGIPDDRWLADHVHPTFAGHQKISEMLVDRLIALGHVKPTRDWRVDLPHRYESHLASLPTAYFIRGERQLAGLRAWTLGRADGPPIESRLPHLNDSPRPAASVDPSIQRNRDQRMGLAKRR